MICKNMYAIDDNKINETYAGSTGVFFTHQMKSAFICVIAILTIAFSGASAPVLAQSDESSGLKDARKKLNNLRKVFDEAREKQKGVTQDLGANRQQLKDLNQLLIQTASRVKQSEASLSVIERKLDRLSIDEQRIRTAISQRHGVIATMLAVMQRMGRQPPPIMATHRDDALKMVRSAMLLSSVIPQLNSEAKKLSGDLTSLVQIVTTTKTRAFQLQEETRNLAEQRKRIEELIAQKRTNILAQSNELRSLKNTARKYKNSAEKLNTIITKLDKEVSSKVGLGNYQKELNSGNIGLRSNKDPRTGKKLRFVPGSKGEGPSTVLKADRIKPAIAFARAQGVLPLPVSGTQIKAFGATNEYGSVSKGILLGTRNSAQVTSPCDGWIVYSGKFRSYGQLLIINAGGGYHILLAGMGKVDVTVGQFVLTGEPVASMSERKAKQGVAGHDVDQTLYIEFRKNGRPIDPNPWWAEGQRKAQG